MAEFDLNGHSYQLAKLDAVMQTKVMKRISPALASILASRGDDENKGAIIQALSGALSRISDDDLDFLYDKCLTGCRRKNGDTWAKIWTNGNLMFDDIGGAGIMALTVATIQDNLADFFSILPSILEGQAKA